MIDLPDPEKGRKVFEDLYGSERGPRRFRTVLKVLVPLGVIAAVFILVAQITGSGENDLFRRKRLAFPVRYFGCAIIIGRLYNQQQ